jgi:hypothetical protein
MTAARIDFDAWRINDHPMTRADRCLLSVLVESVGCAVSKRELWVAFWGFVPQSDYGRLTSRALDTAVSRLRRKGVPLVNIWGHGWLLPREGVIDAGGQSVSVDRADSIFPPESEQLADWT